MRVEFDRRTAFIYGDKAEVRRRIAVSGDPCPFWVERRGAWATSPAVANRVLDQVEGRQPIVVEDRAQGALEFSGTVPANHDVTQEPLW